MDLLNADAANSNTYASLDPFYSQIETFVPPLNFLADATLLFEGHSRRNENNYQDGLRLVQRNQRQDLHASNVGWSNHESFDLLINAAISEGLYDQNSRLSPPNLADGLLSYGSEVSTYSLVDISQSSQQSNASTYADSLETVNEKLQENQINNGKVVCRLENNSVVVDLRQLFTQQLLKLVKTLKSRTSWDGDLVPIVLKFPSSDINVKLRREKLWPSSEQNEFSVESNDPLSTSIPAVLIQPEQNPIVSSINEIKTTETNGKISTNWKCHLCRDKIYKTRHKLELHFDRHAKRKPVVCNLCQKTFAQQTHLQSHVLRCHTAKSLVCCGCGEKFSYRTLLLTHMSKKCKSQKTGGFQCETCPNVNFTTIGQLGEHFSKNFAHYFNPAELEAAKNDSSPPSTSPNGGDEGAKKQEVEKNFICDICNAAFASSRRLSGHKSSVHNKKHGCQKCGKMFGKKKALLSHAAICNYDSNKKSVEPFVLPPSGSNPIDNMQQASMQR